jgi:large subunit ribosomal protein L13e
LQRIEPKVRRPRGKVRLGKGFSRGELIKAGTRYDEAVKLGIPVDVRRRTIHEENIEALKEFLAEVRKTVKASAK